MPGLFRSLFVTHKKQPTPITRRRLMVEELEARAVPAQYTVTNTQPTGGGSFAQAVADLAGSADATNQIVFLGVSGTIYLKASLTISKSVDISGPGADNLWISRVAREMPNPVNTSTEPAGGGPVTAFTSTTEEPPEDPDPSDEPVVAVVPPIDPTKGPYNLLNVPAGVTVSVTGLGFTGGNNLDTVNEEGRGGAIRNTGTLTLTNCNFQGNKSDFGGALANDVGGTLTLSGTSLWDNDANNDGGAIYNAGVLSINANSQLFTNHAGNQGGAIMTNYRATVLDSPIYGNSAGLQGTTVGKGGGVSHAGTFTMERGELSGNSSTGNGGGFYNDTTAANTVRLEAVAITGNTSAGNGGGVYLRKGGSFTLKNCTLSGNQAAGQGNGIAYVGGDAEVPIIDGAAGVTDDIKRVFR